MGGRQESAAFFFLSPRHVFAPVFTTILEFGTGQDTKSGFPVIFFPESLGMLKTLS